MQGFVRLMVAANGSVTRPRDPPDPSPPRRANTGSSFLNPTGVPDRKHDRTDTIGMSILSDLRLRTKMVLLLGLSAAAMITIVVIGAMTLRQGMMDDRIDKLRAIDGTPAEGNWPTGEVSWAAALDNSRRNLTR